MKIAIKKLAPSLLLLTLFVVACFRLGLWQWDRASEFNKKPVERPRVNLLQIAQPGKSLSNEAYGRLVSIRGTYLKFWLVNDRKVGSQSGTWQVALLDTSRGQILVARGWNQAPLPKGVVEVEGRLYPSQNPETSVSGGKLTRVDPALIVSEASGPLFDGFVIATSEEPSAQIERIPAPQPVRNPPGYYWQHLSYVILWWFFGVLAIVVWSRSARELLKR